MPAARAEVAYAQLWDAAEPLHLFPKAGLRPRVKDIELELAQVLEGGPRSQFADDGERVDLPHRGFGPEAAKVEAYLAVIDPAELVIGKAEAVLQPVEKLGFKNATPPVKGVTGEPYQLGLVIAQLSCVLEVLAQLFETDDAGQAHVARTVYERKRRLDGGEVLPDELQHEQFVEIVVEQRPDDRVDFPVVVMRAPREVDDHDKNTLPEPARSIWHHEEMEITPEDVLVVVDVQNDFCPGGALAVPHGNRVIAPIHRASRKFDHIVLTQDWHPPGHLSFATRHAGKKPFESIETPHGPQELWPDHCVQGTPGADFHPLLHLSQAEMVLRKGHRIDIDSYSAFFENDRATPTGLAGYLRERGLRRVFLAGLAYDFCVGYSALDARKLGFPAVVIREATEAIDLKGSVEKMEEEFRRAGVVVVERVEE